MSNAERRLYRQLKTTAEEHELLSPGDRIMVAISGGKDSHALLVLLDKLRGRLPFTIELVAVHLDQRQPGYDGAPLVSYLETTGIAFEILSEDTYSVVTDILKPGATYCSLCSRLRRGILYTAAERLGCNKIALGHHRDDALETLLLNLFYAGKLQAMPAKYRTDDGRFDVIRPLIECGEDEIAAYARERAFPILPCNLCGSQDGLKRQAMTKLITDMEAEHPHVRSIMLNAIRNVRPSHLLDRDVARAWAASEPPAEPRGPRADKLPRTLALPVQSSQGRRHLPVVETDPSAG